MKPITDDVVHSLMQGVADREKTRRRKKCGSGVSADIINFNVVPKRRALMTPQTKPVRPTISGVFCYVSRLRSV